MQTPGEKLRIAWLNERVHEFPGFFNLLLRSINSCGFQVSTNLLVSVSPFSHQQVFPSGMVWFGLPYIQVFDLIRVVINNLRVKSHSSCSIYLQQKYRLMNFELIKRSFEIAGWRLRTTILLDSLATNCQCWFEVAMQSQCSRDTILKLDQNSDLSERT